MTAANLSGLMIWAHKRTRMGMADGAMLAVNGPVLTYRQMLSEVIKTAWQSDFQRRQFGLVTAAARAAMKRESAYKARVAAQQEAQEAAHLANTIAWVNSLSDGQLLSALDKAERNENPLFSSILNDWQARARNRVDLQIIRSEIVNRNREAA